MPKTNDDNSIDVTKPQSLPPNNGHDGVNDRRQINKKGP